jgi:DNA invertase Pin-like site-specific DNA recombinase
MSKPSVKTSEQPPAVAYLRLDEDSDDYQFAELLKDIAVCCQHEGLRLARTFTDRGYDGRALARPGLADLREALQNRTGLVVVVPTLDHLSPSEVIRGPLILMVHRFGGRLLVANEPNGHTDDFGVTQYGVWVDMGNDTTGGSS